MRLFFVIFISMVLSSCTRPHLCDALDRSTPKATFLIAKKGWETKRFEQVVLSYSQQQKRFALFEVFFTSGFVDEDTKKSFDELCDRNNVDYERLRDFAKDRDHLLEWIESRVPNLDRFLVDSLDLFYEKRATKKEETSIKKVTIDGDRASLLVESISKELGFKHERTIYMRKYGNQWLICPEPEWKDASFEWTIPD